MKVLRLPVPLPNPNTTANTSTSFGVEQPFSLQASPCLRPVRGFYRFCGYLQYAGSLLATAETSLTVTASPAEVEKAEAEAAKAASEAAARAYDEAAERQLKYEEEAPARAAAAKAKAKAEAEERAHKTPVGYLSVQLGHWTNNSSGSAGATEIYVRATAYAHVTIKVSRRGHRVEHLVAEPEASAPQPGYTAMVVPWRCSSPGGTYQYVVTARSDVGPTLTRRGHFSPVSVSRCATIKRHEREALERSVRQYREEVKRRAREEREALEREEYNCRAEGGTPITLHTSEGSVPACRTPGGGLLPVPGLVAKSATATVGAQGRAASPIYFFRLSLNQEPRVRPSEIIFAADGNWDVTGLHWHGWGTGVARSDGTSHVNDCIPSCAQGTITPVPAHVTLSDPGRYRSREMYRCYHLYYTVKTSAPAKRGCL